MDTIQWFPGHMTKAIRMMEEEVRLVDAILFLLDARAPIATYNTELKKIAKNKPILYILNKIDLADSRQTDAFMQLLQKNDMHCMQSNATKTATLKNIAKQIQILLKEKLERDKLKQYTRIPKLMVIGMPNLGKSTLINMLVGEKRAITGNKVGVTRGKQWVRCGDFELLDTPGTMQPVFQNQELAKDLAFIGSINDNILNLEEIAFNLLEKLKESYPAFLQERYNLESLKDTLTIFEAISKKRGFLLKGGEFDYERTAKAILDDFRKGRIGRISLEKAVDFENYFTQLQEKQACKGATNADKERARQREKR